MHRTYTEAEVQRMREDFRSFLWEVWRFLGLPPPTPIQLEIAEFLQHGKNLRMVQAFRGVGKSWITSAYVLWRLWLNPQLKILVVSASKQRADDFTNFSKKLISEMVLLHHLKARPGQRDSSVAFDVGPSRPAHAPSVKSVGIFGQVTGSRADLIVADDVEVPNTSETPATRAKLEARTGEFAALRTHEDSETVYLGTPQSEESLYAKLPAKGYEVVIWPAEVPGVKALPHYKGTLGPAVRYALDHSWTPGTPIDPDRFDSANLAARRMEYGSRGYTMQFMLDCSLSDADKYPLKLKNLMVMALDAERAPTQMAWSNDPRVQVEWLTPVGLTGDAYYRPMMVSDAKEDWQTYTGCVMTIDPSGRGADETGFAIGKMCNGRMFLFDAGGIKGGYETATLETLARRASTYKVNEIVIEDNFGDGMYTALFRPVLKKFHDCQITEVHSTGQKEKRLLQALEPALEAHRLVVDEGLISRDYQGADPDDPHASEKRLFFQMTRLSHERQALRHDDRIEAVAMFVKYWQDQLGVDVDETAAQRKEEALIQDLEEWAERVTHNPIRLESNLAEADNENWLHNF